MSRRLRLFALLFLLVALVTGVILDLWAGRRVDAELARLEKRYGTLDGGSLVASPVAPEYNSARFVRAGATLTVPGQGTIGYGAVQAAATRVEQLSDSAEVPEDVRAAMEANRDAVRVAEGAIDRRQASWGADYAGRFYEPRWLEVRTLSSALYLAALLDVRAGRIDDASRRVAAGLAVSASIRREPDLIGQLVRIGIAIHQCEALERLIAAAEPSKAALDTLARSLADNRDADPMRIALISELRFEHGRLLRAERTTLGRIGRPVVRLMRLQYLREMERLIELQAGPRPHPPFPDQPRYGRLDWRRLAASFVPGLQRAIDSGDKHNGVLGVAETGVALRRYRLDRGSYPDELSALVPAYLARLPIDPVTGRPPAYVRSGTGFTLKAKIIRVDSSSNAALEWVVAR